jgi:hypothetical protein
MNDPKPTTTPDPSPENVVTLSPGSLVPCLGCGQPFEPRRPNQTHCCAKYRTVTFRKKRSRIQAERDAKIRLLLRTAREAVDEASDLLKNGS